MTNEAAFVRIVSRERKDEKLERRKCIWTGDGGEDNLSGL